LSSIEPITSFEAPAFRWLSNFWQLRQPWFVRLDDDPLVYYPSVEHAYQAAKSRSPAFRERVRTQVTPHAAKRVARAAKGLRYDWHAVRVPVMAALLAQKFNDPQLRRMLVSTYPRQLVEVNTWGDVFWGECPLGVGQNQLGWALMRLRDQLIRSPSGNETQAGQ
jgi:ribA/ribD-fused uncharacterized protein